MNNYQQQYPRVSTTPVQPAPTQSPGLIWVDRPEIVMNWPVSPNITLVFMDTQNPVLYIKSADAMGRPLPIETYDLVKREPKPADEYITRSEIEALFEQYFGGKSKPVKKKGSKTDSEEDE